MCTFMLQNAALWDMGPVHCRICAIAILRRRDSSRTWYHVITNVHAQYIIKRSCKYEKGDYANTKTRRLVNDCGQGRTMVNCKLSHSQHWILFCTCFCVANQEIYNKCGYPVRNLQCLITITHGGILNTNDLLYPNDVTCRRTGLGQGWFR